jgi:sugar O-acyltransferase (sialic acid O-acetyltransferase NeuD family)
MSESTRDLIVYGAGGWGSEIVSMAEGGCTAGRDTPQWRITGYVDDRPEFWGQTIHGVPCLGPLNGTAQARGGQDTWCHVAIGDNRERKRAAEAMKAVGWKPATVVHHSAYLSWEVELGEGSFIGLGATISPSVSIGRHVLINTYAAIGHHAVIGDFAQISLGTSILGHGRVDAGAMIGAHAVVMSNVTVGEWATVAIGTPVLKTVKPGHTISLPLAKTIFKRNNLPVKTKPPKLKSV